MANVGDILPHCTGTGTSSDPYKYSTAEGFVEAIAVSSAYVEAAVENLSFDVNDGVIPSKITINNTSLNGKGTTIRNLYTIGSGTLVSISNQNVSATIRNLNFYNMLLINNDSSTTPFVSLSKNDSYYTRVYNCNFTGVIRGSNFGNNVQPVYISNSYSSVDSWFQDCTFNFDIDVYGSLGYMFSGSRSNRHYLNNCTIKLSGTLHRDLTLIGTLIVQNCTIENPATNPLKSDGTTRTVYLSPSSSANYNYIKLHLTSTNLSTSGQDQKTLINRSLISGGTLSTSGISMQETDPTASDYIYNAQNLADAGFLVGTVIE